MAAVLDVVPTGWRAEVVRLVQRWATRLAAAATSLPDDTATLARMADRLESFAARVGAAPALDHERLEGALAELDAELEAWLRAQAPAELLAALSARAAQRLESYTFASPDTRAETLELMLSKLLRDHYRLPRLGLYYV